MIDIDTIYLCLEFGHYLISNNTFLQKDLGSTIEKHHWYLHIFIFLRSQRPGFGCGVYSQPSTFWAAHGLWSNWEERLKFGETFYLYASLLFDFQKTEISSGRNEWQKANDVQKYYQHLHLVQINL